MWNPTPPAPFPVGDDAETLGRFGDLQTGQLDKANADKGTARFVIGECEKRDAAAIRSLRPRTLLERLTPWRED